MLRIRLLSEKAFEGRERVAAEIRRVSVGCMWGYGCYVPADFLTDRCAGGSGAGLPAQISGPT